ncbi:MAG: AAA family ATPase [Candidatus Omnitrophica bacterium]|nr:AAA family ATPase [Candidatus Omnitrophota bacterium]
MKFWWRRLLIFFRDHWLGITISLFSVLCLGLTWYGMSKLESFYRNMQLATLPMTILVWLVMGAISAFIYVWVMFGYFSKQNRKNIKGQQVDVHFKDVIGIDEAKEEAWEVVQLLKDHARLKKVGGKILKGILMQGPPGCGKTYLAKAIATEAGIPFLSLAASDFVEVFVGVGASRVRKLFKDARRLAYANGACIIFIDELDAVGRSRTFSWMGGQETNSTLNALLVEMDGLQAEQENVIVIGASNAAEETLDVALLRPGRFDRKIYVDRPNLEGREKIFTYYLGKVQADSAIDVGRLARRTVGKTPAEIENMIKEGALIATRNKRDRISYDDLSEALERIELGIKHRKSMSETERRLVAYHEAGHLVVLYLLHPTDDVFKASIIARRGTLGVVHHNPREELHTHSREKLLADVKVSLAGYVSEKLVFGTTSSGVAGDFQHAMALAHSMVWRFGMGSKYLGDWTIPLMPASGLTDGINSQLSEMVKGELNAETNNLFRSCAEEVEQLLKRERPILDRFANELLKREELEYDEIEAIFAEYGKPHPRIAALKNSAPP